MAKKTYRFTVRQHFWAFLRALQQERQIQKEQRHYEKLASNKGIDVLEGSDLKAVLQRRFLKRGLQTAPKKQGELQIIYASHLNNNP